MIPVAFLLESFWQDWEMSSRVGSSCVPSLLEESMPSECPLPILRDLPCWWSTAFFCFLFLEVLQTHGGFTPRSTPLLHSFLFRAFRLRRCGVWFVRSSFSGLCHWWLGEDAGGLLPTAKFRWCQESHWFLLLLRGFCTKLTWEWLLGNGTCCHYSRIPFRDLEGEFDWCIYWSGDHVPAGWQQIIDLESPLGQDSRVSANNGCI